MPTSCWWLREGSAAGAFLLFLLAGHVQVAPAQSLGDIARREAERRTHVTTGRVYTNADLVPSDASAPSPPPVPVEAVAGPGKEAEGKDDPGGPGVEAVIVEAPDKREEQYWRARAQDLRERLAKARAGIATAEARLSRIDAAPQTPTTVREREVIAATLSRLQRDEGSLSEALTRFVTQAQIAQVPEEWTR